MITIRRYRHRDARAVAALTSGTYARFNSAEGTREAVNGYVDSYSPKGRKSADLHRRFSRTPICFVAAAGAAVVGMVRGIENRIVNLFVDGRHHRQGIATRLIEWFERSCRAADRSEIVLRSTLYAVPFYEAMGYRKTTGIRSYHGLSVQPMRKKLR